MPSSILGSRLSPANLAKGMTSQVKSISNGAKPSGSSAGSNKKPSVDKTKMPKIKTKSYVVKQQVHSPLPQGPSEDHTEDTRGTNESDESRESSYYHSEVMQGNGVPGPGSIEYSIASRPTRKKLSVETGAEEESVLGEVKGASNVAGRKLTRMKTASKPPLPRTTTPKKPKMKETYIPKRTNPSRATTPATSKKAELTTISMPDPKYFVRSRASFQSPSTTGFPVERGYSFSDKADADLDDDHSQSLTMASTITSVTGMPPAPTVATYDDDDDSSSSSDEETNVTPPMSTIGGRGRSSSESTMSALTMRRQKMSEEKETILREVHDAAVAHMKRGEMDHALTRFEGIRDVLVLEYFEEHPRVASTLHNIAVVKVRRGEIEEACNIFREAIRIRKEMLGQYNSKVAETLLELGIALLSVKNHSEALDTFNEALSIRRRDSRKEFSLADQEVRDIQLSKILNNIGVVLFECGQSSKALKAFDEALQIQRDVSNQDEDDDLWTTPIILPMSNTLSNIACVHISLEEYEDAIECLDLANSLQHSILDESNPVVLNTLDNLGYCYVQEGLLSNAMPIYEEILLHQEAAHGLSSLVCAATRRSIACIHIANCQFDKALDCMRTIQLIQESHLGPESRRLRNTVDMIRALEKKKKEFLSPSELVRREISKLGMLQLLCAIPADPSVAVKQGSLEELAELRRPSMQCKVSGHKITVV